MNQETFDRIINSGDAVSITPDLMEAAYERASRERSEALMCGISWVRKLAGITFSRMNLFRPVSGLVTRFAMRFRQRDIYSTTSSL